MDKESTLGQRGKGEWDGNSAPLSSFYDLPEKFQKQVREFVHHFSVTDLRVLGSYRSGKQTEESDLDISTFGHFDKRFTYRDLDVFPRSGGVRILKDGKFI